MDNKTNQQFQELLSCRNWHRLVRAYTPQHIAQELDFRRCLELAYDLFGDRAWNDDLQKYAVALLNATRQTYPDEWNETWRYDAFLSMLNEWTRDYDARYEAIKRAYDKTQDNPPPEVLHMLARCSSCPGRPPVSTDQAIEYLKLAISKNLYSNAVLYLRALYRRKDDAQNAAYWEGLYYRIKDTAPKTESLEPAWLRPRAHLLTNADKISQQG